MPAERATTSFLDLPRELRDLIYSKLWQLKAPFEVRCKGEDFIVKYRLSKSKSPKQHSLESKTRHFTNQPPWFLSNNQILEEAIEQFHRNSIWLHCGGIPEKEDTSLQSPRFLLNPWKAHTLRLPEFEFTEDCTIALGDRTSITYTYRPDETFIKGMSRDLVTLSNLRTLELQFILYVVENPIAEKPIVVIDFGRLSQLEAPGLQELEIEVIWSHGYRKENTIAIDRFRERVVELGKALMRNKGAKNISSTEDNVEGDLESEAQPLVVQPPWSGLEAETSPRWFYRFTK